MKYILYLGGAFLMLLSCEKIIEIDLNETNPKPVFESYIENDSTCYVKAAWTSSYYDNTSSPAIVNASILVVDQLGNTDNLIHTGAGIYRGSSLLGTIGNTYTLTIELDGQEYVASSTMPPLTSIDSITIIPTNSFFGGGGQDNEPPKFWAFVNYTDSADFENYYAIRSTYYDSISSDYVTDYRIADDDLSDGISTRSFTTFQRFESGDTIEIEFACIDAVSYLYFKTLEDAISGAGFQSAAPANPTNNFTNAALGYFGAWSKETELYIIP